MNPVEPVAQSTVLVGNTTIRPTDSLYYAGRVATHVLGGASDSRLFRILREEKSWTRVPTCSLSPWCSMKWRPGPCHSAATARE